MEVADGNDYIDYSTETKETSLLRYEIHNTEVWIIVVIGVASLMCCICCLSCFYNFRIIKNPTKAPFPVPPCCPNCLFPRP